MHDPSTSDEPLEIERTYLLDRVPELPEGGETLFIEQGYLPREGNQAETADIPEGRLRRITAPDGSQHHLWTIKRGKGLVRTEIEREISAEDFQRHWPRTLNCRLRKTRHRVPADGFIWEIDVFDDLDLVLVDVEMPSADSDPIPPAWLADHIIREVTDDPAYGNYAIASRLGGASNGDS